MGSGTTAIWAFDFNVTGAASGGNASGSLTADGFGGHFVSSSVSCLVVSGNVATFAGTLAPNGFGLTKFKVTVVDNGPPGSGLDTLAADGSTTPLDCSTATTTNQAPLDSGDITVIDRLPT